MHWRAHGASVPRAAVSQRQDPNMTLLRENQVCGGDLKQQVTARARQLCLQSSACSRQSAAVAMLSRSSSWPVVRRTPPDSCVVPLLTAPSVPSPVRKPPPILDPRKTATLSRHYYPEGGWGWVVAGCSVGVHVLNNGLQLGGGAVLLSAAASTFHTSATNAGTWPVGTGN